MAASAAHEQPCTHLVVFPFPAQGHVNAAWDMALKLADVAGTRMTFVCTEAYVAGMRQARADVGAASAAAIRLVGLPDGLPPERSTADRVDQIRVLIEATERMGPALDALLDGLDAAQPGNPTACILYDFMLWWVGGLGRRRGTPAYVFFPMAASFLSFLIHIPDLVAQGRLPLTSARAHQTDTFSLPGLPSLCASELPDVSWDPNPVVSFDYVVRSTSSWPDASGFLINTVYELEKDTIDALASKAAGLDIRAVGPVLPPSFLSPQRLQPPDHVAPLQDHHEQQESLYCLQWLDSQPPSSVLYIAFGTIASPSLAQIVEIAMGLEAANHRFLWVVRIPLDAGQTDLDKDSVLPEGFEERTKDRGLVVWGLAPQRRVLSHGAIGGFLTHCGWNSTLESLCKGVPFLCWPMFADQSMNSKLLVDVLGVGKTCSTQKDGLVDREEVERMVKVLMDKDEEGNREGELLRLRAAQLRERATTAVLEGGSSYQNLHGFIESIGQIGPPPRSSIHKKLPPLTTPQQFLTFSTHAISQGVE